MHFESYENELLNRMLTVCEVAYLLHVHPSTVRRWEKQGQLKSYRFGSKSVIRFKSEDISNFIHLATNCKAETGVEVWQTVA